MPIVTKKHLEDQKKKDENESVIQNISDKVFNELYSGKYDALLQMNRRKYINKYLLNKFSNKKIEESQYEELIDTFVEYFLIFKFHFKNSKKDIVVEEDYGYFSENEMKKDERDNFFDLNKENEREM